jgi:hypothetical protein
LDTGAIILLVAGVVVVVAAVLFLVLGGQKSRLPDLDDVLDRLERPARDGGSSEKTHGPGIRSEDAPPPQRHANVRATDLTGQRISPGPRDIVLLHISIGQWDPRSIVRDAKPWPNELLPEEELEIVVLVTSTDFTVGSGVDDLEIGRSSFEGVLVLPKTGASRTQTGEGELVVAVRATQTGGLARARISYLYRDAVIQSQQIVAQLGPGTRSIHAVTDFTASATLTDLGSIPDRRRVTVVTNDSGDATHGIVVRRPGGKDPRATPFSVSEAALGPVVGDLRAAIKRGVTGDRHRDKAALIDDLRTLAPLGWQLYTNVFADATDVLPVGPGPRPLIQIVRPSRVRFTLPWNYLYEIFLRSGVDIETVPICPLVAGWNGKDPLVSQDSQECPHAHVVDHSENLLCPFGFWALRQPFEAPGSSRHADASISVQKDATVAIAKTTVDVDTKALTGHISRLAARLRLNFPSIKVEQGSTAEDVRQLLSSDLPIAYFYCHGDKPPRRNSPDTWLAVGENDVISSSDIIGWVKGARIQGRKMWDKVRPLVVINACHSLDMEPETLLSYVDAFVGTANAAGLVGTEVRVPQDMAMDWAESFFSGLLTEGGNALSALAGARTLFLREGNLFGLVYTPHCWGHLSLQAA